jgi:hypothetical protein
MEIMSTLESCTEALVELRLRKGVGTSMLRHIVIVPVCLSSIQYARKYTSTCQVLDKRAVYL